AISRCASRDAVFSRRSTRIASFSAARMGAVRFAGCVCGVPRSCSATFSPVRRMSTDSAAQVLSGGLRIERTVVVTPSYKRRAEKSPVKVENQRVGEGSNERPHNPDLAHSRINPVPAAQDRRKWDAGGGLRELCPSVAEFAAPLGIDGNRAAERQQE